MLDDITVCEGNLDESEKLTLSKSYQAAFTALSFAGQPKFDPLPTSGVNAITKKSHQIILASGLKEMGESRLTVLCQGMGGDDAQLLQKFLVESS